MKNKNSHDPKPLTLSTVVGDSCLLLAKSKLHRSNFFLGDIDWMLIPAIVHGQFKLFKTGHNPIAIALWAYVSDEIQKIIEHGIPKLEPDFWKSGQHLWLIDIISFDGETEIYIEDLKKTVFKDKVFKYHRNTVDGSREVVTISPKKS